MFLIYKEKMFFSSISITIIVEILVSGFSACLIAEFLKDKMIKRGVPHRDSDDRSKLWLVGAFVVVILYFILQLVAIIGVILLAY